MAKRDPQAILQLQVPVIVRLAHRPMSLHSVLALGPGALLELPKPADEALELMVNNKLIGQGHAVKVGENFGLKITSIGSQEARIRALGPQTGIERSDSLSQVAEEAAREAEG
ncbi:MAG: FliM/FliN family flagellar motor switch protein [Phycisphaerales bacterium]